MSDDLSPDLLYGDARQEAVRQTIDKCQEIGVAVGGGFALLEFPERTRELCALERQAAASLRRATIRQRMLNGTWRFKVISAIRLVASGTGLRETSRCILMYAFPRTYLRRLRRAINAGNRALDESRRA